MLMVGDKLLASGKLKLPILIALIAAFSALWLVFTFILNYWSTNQRQEDLTELLLQIDDQLYHKSTDIQYQLLSSATLLASQNDVISALSDKLSNTQRLERLTKSAKSFYRTYSSQALLTKIEIFDTNDNLLVNLGNHALSRENDLATLYNKTESNTGLLMKANGEVNIYATVAVISDQKTIGFIQLSKPLTELISELATLNKVQLLFIADKSKLDKARTLSYSQDMGTQLNWSLLPEQLVLSPIQNDINLGQLRPLLYDTLSTLKMGEHFSRDNYAIGGKQLNLGLFALGDDNDEKFGEILLIKDISSTYQSYQLSLTLTSISFGVIISLIVIVFWYFVGRIERNIMRAEQGIIDAKIQAEIARDEAHEAKLQAEEANKIKSEFLAKMSHELRTPLNAIIGITEMMSEDAEEFGDDDYVEPLGRVLRSGKHLLTLINDILDLSKIEAGKMELHPESFDVDLFIKDIQRTCEPLANKNQNALSFSTINTLGEMYSDSTRLKQILLNLISNACKFTNQGEVKLTTRRDDKHQQMLFEISDNGIGMTAEQQEVLFQDFRQVDSSATRKFEGTGLGLSISKKLAQMMGGDIEVESEINQGSVFRLKLPTNSECTQSPDNVIKAVSIPQKTDRKEHILVVEDDDNMIHMLQHHFAKANLNIEIAKDGNQALIKARENPPTLITLDINIPNLNGWDTLAAMRADAQLKNVPIVVISVQEEKQKGMALGATDYLMKPVNKDQLIGVVDRYVSKKQ